MKRSQGSTPIIMMFNSTLLIVQLLHSVLKTHPAEAAIAIIHYLKLVNSSLSLFFSFHRPPMWQCEWVARRALWLEKLWPLVICQSEASEARKACLIHCKASWLKPPSEVSWRSLLHLYLCIHFLFWIWREIGPKAEQLCRWWPWAFKITLKKINYSKQKNRQDR